jgi:hypothetical protein
MVSEIPSRVNSLVLPSKLQVLSEQNLQEGERSKVGIVAASWTDGKEKPFTFWRNMNFVFKSQEEGKKHIATFFTQMILDKGVDVIMGPSFDERHYNKTGEINSYSLIGWSNVYGFYVASSDMKYVSRDSFLGGVKSEERIRKKLDEDGKPNLFKETFEKIQSNIPDLK